MRSDSPAISNQILDAARRYAEAELETVRSLLRHEPLTVAYLHKKDRPKHHC